MVYGVAQTAVESLREVVRLWRVDCLPRQSRLYLPEGQNLAQSSDMFAP